MEHSNFVHLHVHSQYSLLDGAIRFEDVFALAKQYHMGAVALTDHGNMYGAIDFYKSAGDQLLAREAWLFAAQLYTQLAHVLPMMPAELKDKFHHSIFKAYKDPRAPQVLPLSNIITIDPLLAGVAQARHTLYHTGLARAQALVTGILKRQKDYPEARLVQAEINIKTKRFEEAKIILDELIQAPDLPAWIKQEAKVILDSAKP